MKITGQILKENREKKGISISEVALATKINNKTLIAMEEGDLGNLPPKTFLRGFVRAYASYLGLDVENILNTFYEEMGTTKPKLEISEPAQPVKTATPSSPRSAAEDIDSDSKSASLVKYATIGGIVFLILLIIFFKKKMDSYENEAVKPEVPAEIEAVQNPTDSPSDSPSPSPTGTPETTLAVEPSPSVTPSPTATPEPTPTPKASPTATPKPTPKPTPTPTPSPTATPTPKPTATPSPTPKATATPNPAVAATGDATKPKATPAGRPQEVIIEALDVVEVDAQIDNEPVKKFKLRADQVQTIKAKKKVSLKFSDGGAVNIILNGVERGVPGDLGKPLKVELP